MTPPDHLPGDTANAALFTALSEAMCDLVRLTTATEADILRAITAKDAQGGAVAGIQNLDLLQQALTELAVFCRAVPDALETAAGIDPLVASLRLERLRHHFAPSATQSAEAVASDTTRHDHHTAAVMLFSTQTMPPGKGCTDIGPASDRSTHRSTRGT